MRLGRLGSTRSIDQTIPPTKTLPELHLQDPDCSRASSETYLAYPVRVWRFEHETAGSGRGSGVVETKGAEWVFEGFGFRDGFGEVGG
jgi:hypothetical protein